MHFLSLPVYRICKPNSLPRFGLTNDIDNDDDQYQIRSTSLYNFIDIPVTSLTLGPIRLTALSQTHQFLFPVKQRIKLELICVVTSQLQLRTK